MPNSAFVLLWLTASFLCVHDVKGGRTTNTPPSLVEISPQGFPKNAGVAAQPVSMLQAKDAKAADEQKIVMNIAVNQGTEAEDAKKTILNSIAVNIGTKVLQADDVPNSLIDFGAAAHGVKAEDTQTIMNSIAANKIQEATAHSQSSLPSHASFSNETIQVRGVGEQGDAPSICDGMEHVQKYKKDQTGAPWKFLELKVTCTPRSLAWYKYEVKVQLRMSHGSGGLDKGGIAYWESNDNWQSGKDSWNGGGALKFPLAKRKTDDVNYKQPLKELEGGAYISGDDLQSAHLVVRGNGNFMLESVNEVCKGCGTSANHMSFEK